MIWIKLLVGIIVSAASACMGGCDSQKENDENGKDQQTDDNEPMDDIIEGIKQEKPEVQPPVEYAEVTCTCAENEEDTLYVVNTDGNKVELANIPQLIRTDIKLWNEEKEHKFKKCIYTDDLLCLGPEIEGGEWKGYSETTGQGVGKENLDKDESYMICTKGFGIVYFTEAGQVVKTFAKEHIGRYPKAYLEKIIYNYEQHKMENGRFVPDNGGRTIGYGHDIDIGGGEDFSKGLSVEEAKTLALIDLEKKYKSITGLADTLNSVHGYNIDIDNFTENEVTFLVDFSYNRGNGLVKRYELEHANKPYSSLAFLIIAVSEKDDQKIIDTLMEETKNLEGIYLEGLELRRMDQYEILKFGDFERDEDIERDYTKQKNK